MKKILPFFFIALVFVLYIFLSTDRELEDRHLIISDSQYASSVSSALSPAQDSLAVINAAEQAVDVTNMKSNAEPVDLTSDKAVAPPGDHGKHNTQGSDGNKGKFEFAMPESSLAAVRKTLEIEYCIDYLTLIHEHGSIASYSDKMTNLTGGENREGILAHYKNADKNCAVMEAYTELELLKKAEQHLYDAAGSGNEYAQHRIAIALSQKAVFATNLYTESERLAFYQESIQLFSYLAEKGHSESMLSLIAMLTDSATFPQFYDPARASYLAEKYEFLTGKNISYLLNR